MNNIELKNDMEQKLIEILWTLHVRFPQVPLDTFENVIQKSFVPYFQQDLAGKSDDELQQLAAEIKNTIYLELAKQTA